MPQTQNTLSEQNKDKPLTDPSDIYSPFVLFNDTSSYSDYRMTNGRLWKAVVVA
jgi:hypothetical protein